MHIGTIIPATMTSINVKYKTSQTVGFERTYLQPKTATTQIISAVASACITDTAVANFDASIADKIKPMRYKIAAAPKSQNEILFKPQKVLFLGDELFFVVLVLLVLDLVVADFVAGFVVLDFVALLFVVLLFDELFFVSAIFSLLI